MNSAREFISHDEARFEDVITDLEISKKSVAFEQERAEQYRREAESLKKEVEYQKEKTREQKEKILQKAREEAKQIYAQAKEEADQIIKEMNREAKQKNQQKALENRAKPERKAVFRAGGLPQVQKGETYPQAARKIAGRGQSLCHFLRPEWRGSFRAG